MKFCSTKEDISRWKKSGKVDFFSLLGKDKGEVGDSKKSAFLELGNNKPRGTVHAQGTANIPS